MAKPRKTTADPALVVPIAGDAAIAGPVADGRLLPVLILDTSARPELAELIRVHRHLPPGDGRSQWASSRDDDDVVFLQLWFEQPIAADLILRFSIERQAILVESMLSGGGVYLQSGQPGDRLMNTMNEPRVLVELPDTGFRSFWDELLLARMTAVMARRLGVPRRKGRSAAASVISEMRMVARLRMRSG
ncbi:MAG: hypothetical protein AB7H43_08250 [Acidimicrobiia bacterium]